MKHPNTHGNKTGETMGSAVAFYNQQRFRLQKSAALAAASAVLKNNVHGREHWARLQNLGFAQSIRGQLNSAASGIHIIDVYRGKS